MAATINRTCRTRSNENNHAALRQSKSRAHFGCTSGSVIMLLCSKL